MAICDADGQEGHERDESVSAECLLATHVAASDQTFLCFALAEDKAGMDVDLASAVFALDRRAVARPWLRGFADQATALARNAHAGERAALDETQHLPVWVEEPTAQLAEFGPRCLGARVSLGGAVAKVTGVATVALRGAEGPPRSLGTMAESYEIAWGNTRIRYCRKQMK